MDIPSKYNPQEVEERWYPFWENNGFFSSKPDGREPYTIVIPPPNVTGVLHMGHMLNNTIQDVLIRKARLEGKNACWVPGTDHASIATEAKVVAKLKSEGIEKSSLSREEFLKHAWDWTHEYGGVILKQLRKLGCSCDWSRTKFTMDEDMYDSVIKVFVDLYNKGLIYRGYRMVNWDPEAQTTLSDEEVIYEERQGTLFYLNYPIVTTEGNDVENEFVTIATTRPETILGDTAICVHPEDERYLHLKGKFVRVPICNRIIPIIQDEYVDISFGTGCLKVTPAHDENDKMLGEKHGLEVIDIFNADATLNSYGLHYQGKDRFVVRKEISVELANLGALVKKENHINKVGTSERTKAVIEPRLSDQWFLKMEDLAKPALEAVIGSGAVKLHPQKFANTYQYWMENIRDWNISRQLWWGQQIPAYYYGDAKDDFVVAASKDQALQIAKEKTKNEQLQLVDLRQDEDVLDTWFSSWLWPISVFGGILNPDNEEIKYYYPTNDLVTGPDILFFWVARMIIAGYEYRGVQPFSNVYLTGLVRDKQRRKMSKQLGNSPDALNLISQFGADGVRVGLLLSSAAGNDLLFDEALCQQGANFANKIWNAFRLIMGWETEKMDAPKYNQIGLAWYASKYHQVLEEVEDQFSKYRISDALMAIYKLIWDDFCSWLLEIVKPEYQQPIDEKTKNEIIFWFEQNLRLLHPFMPFLSEEIWQHIAKRETNEALCIASWPQKEGVDLKILSQFEFAVQVITEIRRIRKEKNIPFKEVLELLELNQKGNDGAMDSIIKKLANISSISDVKENPTGALSFRVNSSEFFIPISGTVNVEAERQRIIEELNYTKGFLSSVERKLSNQKFVNNAPVEVVELEKKKAQDAKEKIDTLENSLSHLG